MNKKLLYIIFILVAILAVINYIAGAFYFYWTISWFDNVVHFLGGVCVGLISIWIFYVMGLLTKGRPSLKRAILTSLAFVLAVGVAWEIFEYLIGATQSTESYPLDVFHDLLSDMVGAIVAGYIGIKEKFYHA
jgi:hypothetical protein